MIFGPASCHKCGSIRLEWVGYSARALKRLRPSPDVHQCQDCGATWLYARTGKRITQKQYQPV